MGSKNNKYALSAVELSALFTSMSMVLESGVTISDCLSMMVEDTEEGRFKKVLKSADENLMDEYFLYKALEKSGGFPEYALGMIEVGETSGRLSEVLSSLGDYYLREDSIKKQIKSAVLSPLLLITMMAVVVLFLVYAIMPVFKDVFRQLGVDLAGMSSNAVAFQVGNMIMVVVGIILIFLLACVLFYAFSQTGKNFFINLSEKFFMTRDIVYKMDAARFMGALSTLMTSGIAMEEALELAKGTTTSNVFSQKAGVCISEVEGGKAFEEAVLD
ncbi:MAG: type II secretion system F family protein, partial [Eubacterium sp.]